MNTLYRSFIMLLIVFSAESFAGKPIKNLIDIPVPVTPDGTLPSFEQVRSAIISACRKRGWTPVLEEDNKVKASILVRSKHFAEIEIPFSQKEYSILYKSSRELDYNEKKKTIHRNYNKWVVMLSNSIQRQFGVRSQGF